jgi:hypothetical protein
MSTYLTAALQHKAKAERGNNGEVIVASIWLALYLLMVVGALFAKQHGSVVLLVLSAAVLGGWGVLGARGKKHANPIVKSRKSFARVSPKNIAPTTLLLFVASTWTAPSLASPLPPTSVTGDVLAQFWQTATDPASIGPGDVITAPSQFVSGSGFGSASAGYAISLVPFISVRTDAVTPDAAHQSHAVSEITLQYFFSINGPRAGEIVPVIVTAQAFFAGSFTGNVTTNGISADLGFALNSSSANLLFHDQGGSFTSKDTVNLISGDVYIVNMFADLESIARGPGRATGEATIDPVFTVDPNFADAGLFSLGFSDGIENVAQSATPLPGALPLFATVLGGWGVLGWRRKKKTRIAA